MKKIETKEIFSLANMCVYAVLVAICVFPFRKDINNLFVLKNDYTNTVVVPGVITYKHTSGGSKHKFYNYRYDFILNEEKMSGKFSTNMTLSFTKTYEKGEPINILYNKRINFFYPKDALKGEIAEYVNLIMFVSFLLLIAFIIIKKKITS